MERKGQIDMIKYGILHRGDEVINVTQDFIAVRRKNGEVDIIELMMEESGVRINLENIVTIGYGNNTVETSTPEGVSVVKF